MVLFAFGPDADSWLIGNHVFNAYQNLPETFANPFKDKTLTPENVQWGSVGPNGLCCFLLTNDTIFCTQVANLVADVKPTSFYGLTIQPIDHVTFSPSGGWFVRYKDGNVRLSMVGSFPASFHRITGPHLQMSNATSPQYSSVQYVFFGAGDTVLIQLTNGAITWNDLPESLVKEIHTKVGEGWILSKKSTLCQWNKDYYFIKWTRYFGLETSYSWRVHPSGILTDILIREVVEGQVPVSHTVRNPTPAPPVQLSTQVSGSLAVALYNYNRRDEDEIDLKEDEYITNIEFLETDWWRGQNQQGKVGLFPSMYVQLVSGDVSPSTKEAATLRQPEIKPPNGVSPVSITCDGCSFEVVTGFYYHCGICNSDNLDLCEACFDAGAWCFQDHPVIKRSLQNDKFNPGISSVQLPDISLLRLSSSQDQTASSSSLLPRPTSTPNPPSPSPSPRTQSDKTKDDYAQGLRDALERTVVSESPNVHWDHIAGLDQAKEELQETTILPIKFPQLFTGNRKARRGILLYGPPGTGKSFLAKAVATEVDCPLFSISSSDIASKWIGESERLVKTLFELARERKPCVIFIDEIEALCGSRESQSEHSTRILTEFLVQMDGVGHDSSGVLVLAATNLPWKLDSAVRRRFQRRIHISLPDQKARTRMFEITVGDTPCNLSADDYARLGSMTEGFSGSDISIAVQDALMEPVKKIRAATHYRKVVHEGNQMLTPSGPHEPGAIAMTWRQVPTHKLLEPPLLASDFFNVLHKVKPSVSEEDIRRNQEWTEEYGSEGA